MDGYFVTVARDADVAEGGQRLIQIGSARILLVRSDGQLFAVENRCTHDGEPLLGGMVRKCAIVCPVHGARFRLSDGRPYGPPAFEPLRTYAVRVSGGDIEVAIPAP